MKPHPASLADRAAVHAALGEPARLAIVDALALGDRAPSELGRALGLPSNLLAHHVEVLERAGLIERLHSSGDGRRRYLRLRRERLAGLLPAPPLPVFSVLFVCTENSARSQFAAALWRQRSPLRAESAGTRPARRVHPGAVQAARRHGIDLADARPRAIDAVDGRLDLLVTVCDEANERLQATGSAPRLHWSIRDPVLAGTPRAFDAAIEAIRERVDALVEAVSPTPPARRGEGTSQ